MASDALKLASWVINKESVCVECKRCPHKIDLSPSQDSANNYTLFNNEMWFSVGWLLEAIVRDGHDCSV